MNHFLDYWKGHSWKREDLLSFFKANNSISRSDKINNKALLLVDINRRNVRFAGHTCGKRFITTRTFFNDIKRQFRDLECTLLLSVRDEIYDKKWEYHNVGNDIVDKPELHSYHHGISSKNSELIRIENSNIDTNHYNFPIFSFSKTDTQDTVIPFPHENLLQNNFYYNDSTPFSKKIDNVPIYRFSNPRFNLLTHSRFKLLDLSYNNPHLIDCKAGYKGIHPGYKDYVIHTSFIKLYNRLGITNISDLDLFKKYVHISNYTSKSDILKNKYIICNDSWYNTLDYACTNSVLLRYKYDKTKFLEDFVFVDGRDYIVFDETNLKEKMDYVKNNPSEMDTMIKNRKDTLDYFKYDNMVQEYGKLLQNYSKICKKNQII